MCFISFMLGQMLRCVQNKSADGQLQRMTPNFDRNVLVLVVFGFDGGYLFGLTV
jgi:hypothetical protein